MKTELATVAHIWCPLPNEDARYDRYVRVSRNSRGGYTVVTAINAHGLLDHQPVSVDRDQLIALRDALTLEIDATA